VPDNQGGITSGHFPTDDSMNLQKVEERKFKPSFEIDQFSGKKFLSYADTRWQAQ
jgi:hypothetical protein